MVRERCEASRLFEQASPGTAEAVSNGVEAGEQPMRQGALARIESDLPGRFQLRAAGSG